MARVLLVRHCEAAWLEDNRARPLSERGLEQAQALGTWLRARWPIDAIISSPYRRTVETISPYAALAGHEVVLDERLREREAPFQPVGADHVAAAEACFSDHSLRLEGSESGFDAQTRGWEAIESALRSSRTLPVLVSHGQLLSFTLARIDGTSGSEIWRAMTTPDVFLLEEHRANTYSLRRVWESTS